MLNYRNKDAFDVGIIVDTEWFIYYKSLMCEFLRHMHFLMQMPKIPTDQESKSMQLWTKFYNGKD